MTLKEFDRRMELADHYRKEARKMLAMADNMERSTIEEAGVIEHDRDPGFNRWEHKRGTGYHSTPRQALEAAIMQGVNH